jgi:ribonuclease-3
LLEALTHRSRALEEGSSAHGYERLEFLGDAVLGLLTSELLMERYPEVAEGTLARAREELVRGSTLARVARALGLADWIRLGKGEERSGGRNKDSILENALEAVLGALYLDGGLEAARRVVRAELGAGLAEPGELPLHTSNPKNLLQEHLMKRGEPMPSYRMVAEVAAGHAPEFEVEVVVGGRVLGRGTGSSKRAAELAAASEALGKLGAAP